MASKLLIIDDLSRTDRDNSEGLSNLAVARIINSLQPRKLARSNSFPHSQSTSAELAQPKTNPPKLKKHCAKCGKNRTWEAFRAYRSGMNGRYYLDSYCKRCRGEYYQAWMSAGKAARREDAG